MTDRRRSVFLRVLPWCLTACLLLFLAVSCARSSSPPADPLPEAREESPPPAEGPADPREQVDLSLAPNEMGQVMILMYHGIGPRESEWVRTPENFRRDLAVLYEQGYRPLSLREYLSGDITTEAGYTPVILTFDDGLANQFRYREDGSIDPDSAVGILLEFHRQHPDFPLAATFFVDGNVPFRQPGTEREKVAFLLSHGMDIGNHGRTHRNLRQADALQIQEEIGAQARYLESLVDPVDYRVDTLALPYGVRPAAEDLWVYLEQGVHEGFAYENRAVLNVGSNPARSPYDRRFDPLQLPRVRASETDVGPFGLYAYLEYFAENPRERFISDGVPEVITVPDGRQEDLKETDRWVLVVPGSGQEQT